MRAEIRNGKQTEELVFPNNTVFVNVVTDKITIKLCDEKDVLDILGLDLVPYEKMLGNHTAKLFACVDGDGKFSKDLQREFRDMEIINLSNKEFSLKVIV